MSTSNMERLHEFIVANFYIPPEQSFDGTTSFLQHGIIDSTGVLEIVTFIESEFGITVSDHELVPSNFDSLVALCAFVRRKQDADGKQNADRKQDRDHVLFR